MASPAISWLPRKWHYAWVIVGVCFAVAVMTAGVRSTPGVLIVPLEDEFGWSRATISFALGINLLLFGAIGPFAGPVRSTPHNHPGACRHRRQRGADPSDEPALATHSAMGCGRRAVHRVRRWVSGGVHRRALVPGTGRLRRWRADCCQRPRPVGLLTNDGLSRHPLRVANDVAGLGGRGCCLSARSGLVDARSARGCRSWPLAIWARQG